MPIAGTRTNIKQMGKSYEKDPLRPYVETFLNTTQNILTESGTDLFSETTKTLMLGSSNDTLMNFFVEQSFDDTDMDPADIDDNMEMMTEQYKNDREAVLEYANMGSFNPVIGISFPIHKNILMNCIFDKGAIPKVVAVSPKFTISMETRLLVTPDGTEIDMWKQQNQMTAAMDATVPVVEVELTLPEKGTTNILQAIGASSLDHLSVETKITGVKYSKNYKKGETMLDGTVAAADDTVGDAWATVDLKFSSGYGDFDRSLTSPVVMPADAVTQGKEVLNATMQKDKFTIMALTGLVKAVKLAARKDTSNGLTQACSVSWRVKTDLVEIPSAVPINTPVSPEEVKDLGALYQVNQLTKLMSMFKLVLENYKDDKIHQSLDESFTKLQVNEPSASMQAQFDFAPREGYALDHVEWRHKTFFDALDTHVTDLLQYLNDPNVVITIFGRPDIIRKITPTEYTYHSPSSIGPVELDFVKTIVTSDKRTYQFISSQKLRKSDDLIIILCPRNTDRIIYRIYDYQMYVSNEIRNVSLYTLPAIHAFQRWKFVEYQPVQGRMTILNPTGLKNS